MAAASGATASMPRCGSSAAGGAVSPRLDAPLRLVRDGRLDYLTLEYLAELTMSILALLRQRDPAAGYAHDFLDVLERLTPILRDQPRLKVVTNAGGTNPPACAARAKDILARAGLAD